MWQKILQGLLGALAFVIPLPTRAAAVEVRFADETLRSRYEALAACFEKAAGPEWRRRGPEVFGNFIESRWCRGAAAKRNCATGGYGEDDSDQTAYTLYALAYEVPDAFGLGFGVSHVPATRGWKISVSYSENGKGVVGEHFTVAANRWDGKSEMPQLIVPTTGYELHETMIFAPLAGSLFEQARLVFSSSENFKRIGLSQLDKLAAKVSAAISAGEIEKCEYGEYKGDGIPPECHKRKLTPAEQKAELITVREEFAAKKKILSDHGEEIFKALQDVFPADGCFK